MRILSLLLVILFGMATFCFAAEECTGTLLLDDFEGEISGGPEGTVDFGAGCGSALEVTAETSVKYSGEQSLKLVYDAVAGGYMWAARGFNLDAANAGWLKRPAEIKWDEFGAISVYVYGGESWASIAFDIKDNGNEMWRYLIADNFREWKKIVCNFNDFYARDDWQPENADKNGVLDFPIHSFQFEPRPEAKGTIYLDKVELVKK